MDTSANINSATTGYYKISESFQQYWDGREIDRGKGWKPFKRWEHFMTPRVYPTGTFDTKALWNAYMSEKQRQTRDTITASWQHLGPVSTPTSINSGDRRGSGRVNTVAFHPSDPSILYAGSPSGGFWKSTNGGASWQTTTDDLMSIGVSDIAIHPVHPDTIYIATGDGDAGDTYSIGVLRSTDGGITWEPTGSAFLVTSTVITRRILIDPQNNSVMLVATSGGIYKSEDDGVTWIKRISGNFKDIEYKPGNSSIVYATRYAPSGGAAMYKSVNGGTSFAIITTTGITASSVTRIELAVSPAAPSSVYAVTCRSDDYGLAGVYKSTDEGVTWTQVFSGTNQNLLGWSTDGSDAGGQGWYDLVINVSPVDPNVIFVGGVNVWKSANGGASWTLSGHWTGSGGASYVHADHHFFAYSPHTNFLYSGNDGGLYYTDDEGENWIDISDGLEILQIYRSGISTDSVFYAVTGAQDNGTMRRDTNGTWNAILGGDGMECLIDYSNNEIIYGETYYGSISKSVNRGYSFDNITPHDAGQGDWVTPYVIDPLDPNTIYAGYVDLWKTTDGGDSWDQISELNLPGPITALAVAPSDPNYIYISTGTRTFRTSNGGQSWTNITAGLPGLYLTYMAVSQYDPKRIWITFSGYTNMTKVYYSTNAGTNWANISQGLPNIPANAIVYEHNSNAALYCGTDLGVYYRNNLMTEWAPFNNGMPNVIINELEINYISKQIVAATYGRGLWVSPLYEEISSPTATIGHYFESPCEGVVRFFDLSTGEPDTWVWDFGDGSSSTDANPQHTYDTLGQYAVSLIVSNSFGSDTIESTIDFPEDLIVANFSAGTTGFCSEPATINFTNNSQYASDYQWDFGDGTTSTEAEPSHTYIASGFYAVSLIASADLCPADTLTMVDFVSIDPMVSTTAQLPVFSTAPTVLCCSGNLYDNGGTGNYKNNSTGKITIMPSTGSQMRITFSEFDIEAGDTDACENDYLLIYDGSSSSSPLIGKYCNSNLPPAEIYTSGSAFTVRQVSNSSVSGSGFILAWDCITGVDPSEKSLIPPVVYPNPSGAIVTIDLSEPKPDAFVEIIDIQGNLIAKSEFQKGRGEMQIDFSSHGNGIYLIRVWDGAAWWGFRQAITD